MSLTEAETQTANVLLRSEVYDDSPWTDEEMDLLAEEAGELLDSFGKDA